MADAIQHWDGVSWKNSEFYRTHTEGHAILVCGGPSLKNLDIPNLTGPGKTVLGMNTTYPFVRPDLWIGMDNPRCYNRHLPHEAFPKIYRGNHWKKVLQGTMLRDVPNSHFMSIVKQKEEDYWKCFHEENECFTWEQNTFSAAVALLLSMGFKHIHLAGCDLTNKKSDYFDERVLREDEKDSNNRLHASLFTWLRKIQPELKRRGITLWSLSEGSRINKFLPYMPLEELNEKIEKEELFTHAPLYNSLALEKMAKGGVKDEDIK
jgi:hypothetical protein